MQPPDRILELQNMLHDVPELHKTSQSSDYEALKLWKGRSGTALFFPDNQAIT